MNVLISLVGGQSYPVYAHAMYLQPDTLVLIHSNSIRLKSNNIKDLIEAKQPGINVLLFELSAINHQQDDELIAALADEWCTEGNEVWLNLVGGTKHWSLMFYKHFRGRAQTHQILIDQNNNIIDIDTLEETHVNPLLSIDDVFALHGVTVNYVNYNTYTDEDRNCLEEIENLRAINKKAFHMMADKMAEELSNSFSEDTICVCYRNNAAVIVNENNLYTDDVYIIWYGDYGEFECRMANSTRNMNVRLNSPHIKELIRNTGWFEFKVADIISRWPEAQSVYLNCRIQADNGQTFNELDVVVVTQSRKWLFVECKTRVFNPTDIDKFNDVVRKYSGIGSKKIFITERPMNVNDQTRCALSQISNFDTTNIADNPPAFYERLSGLMSLINPQ